MLVDVSGAFSDLLKKAPVGGRVGGGETDLSDSKWLMVLTALGRAADAPCVDQRFWSRATSTDQWDPIVMQTWDD